MKSACQSTIVTDCSHKAITMQLILVEVIVMALWLQSVTIVDQQTLFTGTSTRISGMVMAMWLQSVAIVDQQAIFTEPSTEISSMEVAQCLQSVAVVVSRRCPFTRGGRVWYGAVTRVVLFPRNPGEHEYS